MRTPDLTAAARRRLLLRSTASLTLAALATLPAAALAGGPVQSPGNAIVPDGRTATGIAVDGRVTTITTTTIVGANAYNSFSTFVAGANNVVNLLVPDQAGKLVNIVRNGPVDIEGTVNAYKGGQIGGNVVFADSFGMIVGATGSLNVGGLTLITPSRDTIDRLIDRNGIVDPVLAARLDRGDVPLSADGTIVVEGHIHAQHAVAITAADVRIAGSRAAATRAAIGKAKFIGSVNVDNWAGGSIVVRDGVLTISSTSDLGVGGQLVAGGSATAGGVVRLAAQGTLTVDASATIHAEAAPAAGGTDAPAVAIVSLTGGAVVIDGALAANGRDHVAAGRINVATIGDITVGSTALLAASGTGAVSNGGTISVIAGGNLSVASGAVMLARGGVTGDGGATELSARGTATLGTLFVDLAAPGGRAGSLLLDPTDLVIGGPGTAALTINASFAPSLTTNGGSVTLLASRSIAVAADGLIDTTSTTGSGNITLEAPSIALAGGSRLRASAAGTGAAGDITLTATAAADGLASIAIGDGSALVASIDGGALTLTAVATAGTPTAHATIAVQNATIGARSITANATATGTVVKNGLAAVATGDVVAAIDVLDGAVITTTGDVALTATAQLTASASGAVPAAFDLAQDASAAIVSATSTGRSHIGGSAIVKVGGKLSITANDTVASTAIADASGAGADAAGATVAVNVVDAHATALVDGAATITAGALTVGATSSVAATTTAKAAAQGASKPAAGSTEDQYLSGTGAGAKYASNEKTSDGAASVAGALSIADYTSTTAASLASSVAATVIGAVAVTSSSHDASAVLADGSSASGKVGVGAALGLGITHIANDASVAQAISAGSLMVGAISTGTATDNAIAVKAVSGAAGADVGVAGALSVDLLDTESVARLTSAAQVTLTGGAASLTSNNLSSASSSALPAGDGAVGAKVGVGASVALNLVATRSFAELDDGSRLTGASDVTLQASGGHGVVTQADQGSAGGVAITPVLALALVSDETEALIGALGGGLSVSGSVSVTAQQSASALTQASGRAAGGKAAIGAAVAVAVLDETALATTSSSIAAGGAVTFNAQGAALATTAAWASASGGNGADDNGKSSDADGSVDAKVQKQTTGASARASDGKIGSGEQQTAGQASGSSADGKASTNEGSIAVAAAVGVTVAHDNVHAYVPAAVGVSAGGPLKVITASNADSRTLADATAAVPAADDGKGGTTKVGIGAAVAVNVVTTANAADLGGGVLHSASAGLIAGGPVADYYAAGAVRVAALDSDLHAVDPTLLGTADFATTTVATTPLGRADQYQTQAMSGASGSKVGVAGAFAGNILDVGSTAQVGAGANVVVASGIMTGADGSVAVAADTEAFISAEALPAGSGVTGGSLGVGASVAFNKIVAGSNAEIAAGATVTGATELTIDADSHLDTLASAKGGASGGTAIDAVVALTLLTETTAAKLSAGGALDVGGDVAVRATASGDNSATADGKVTAGSGGTGVGAALALITGTGVFGIGASTDDPVTSRTSAEVDRDIVATGALEVAATATHSAVATATATAGGGMFDKADPSGGGKSASVDTLQSSQAQGSMDEAQKGESGNGGPSKGAKLSVAAAVGATIVGDLAAATISGDAADPRSLTASSIKVTASNAATTKAKGDGASTGKSTNGVGIGAALDIIDNATTASLGASTHLITPGAVTVSATSSENQGLLGLAAEAMSGASAEKIAVAGSLAVVVSHATTAATVGADLVVDAAADTATRAGAVKVAADNTSELAAKAWSGRYSSQGTGVGASIAAAISLDHYTASIGDNAHASAADFTVTAVNEKVDHALASLALLASDAAAGVGTVSSSLGTKLDSDKTAVLTALSTLAGQAQDVPLLGENNYYTEVVAGAASGEQTAIAGGFALQLLTNATSATIGTGAQLDLAGALKVHAEDDAVSRTLAGAFSVSGGGNAAGITSAIIVNSGPVTAQLGDTAKVTATGAVGVDAKAAQDIDVYEVAAGVADSSGIAGVLGVVTSLVKVAASTGTGNVLDAGGAVTVGASDSIAVRNLGGAVAVGGTNGIGGTGIVTTISNNTSAVLGSTAAAATKVTASALDVEATSGQSLLNVAVAGAAAGSNAIAGAVTPLTQIITTAASIGAGATVSGGGDITVKAANRSDVVNVGGVLAAGGEAGVGAAAAVDVLTDTVTAVVGDGAKLDARGAVAVSALAAENVSTTAIAGAAGLGSAGVGVSLGSTIILDTTQAYLGHAVQVGLHVTPASVMVVAQDASSVIDLVGSLGIGSTGGVAAGADANVLTKNTDAWIGRDTASETLVAGDAADVRAVGDIVVRAVSLENVFSLVAGLGVGGDAGVAGSAGVYVLDGHTLAGIGDFSRATASGNVAVLASDSDTLNRLVGSGAAGGTAGVGAAIGVAVDKQTTRADIGDHAFVSALGQSPAIDVVTGITGTFADYGSSTLAVTAPSSTLTGGQHGGDLNATTAADADTEGASLFLYQRTTAPILTAVHGVAVSASATNLIRSAAVSGSVGGTAAISLSGDIPVVVSDTEATIGGNAAINQLSGANAAQGVTVAASSDLYHLGIAGSVAVGGTAGIGGGAETTIIQNTTIADIGAGATVAAHKEVTVTARAAEDFASTALSAGVGGEVGVAGGITGFVVSDTTKAAIESDAADRTHVSSDGNVVVTADDQTRAIVAGGTLAIGGATAGVGIGVGIAVVTKDTEAVIGADAVVQARASNLLADPFKAYTGTDFTTQADGRGLLVAANSGETLRVLVAAGAGGLFAGVGGAISAEVFVDKTQASIGSGATINANNGSAGSSQDVDVIARDSTAISALDGTLAVGLVGVAGAVDVAVITASTSASIGDGATVTARGGVSVDALTSRATSDTVASIAGGLAGVGAAISVLAVADGPTPDQSSQTDRSGTSFNSDSDAKLKDDSIDAKFLKASTNANIQKASADAQSYKGAAGITAAETQTAIKAGNSSSVGSALITAGGTVTVNARDGVSAASNVGAATTAIGGGAGVSVAVVTVDDSATVAAGARISGDAIAVTATSVRDFGATAVSATGIGLAASLISQTDTTTTTATGGGMLTANGALAVGATTDDTVLATSAAAAGGVAAGLNVVVLTPDSEASLAPSSQATAGVTHTGDLSVTAHNGQSVDSRAIGVAVGGGGGAGLAIVVATPVTSATIGGAVVASASGDVALQATSTQHLNSVGAGLSLGDGAGGALTVYVLGGSTTAEIGAAQVTAGGNIAVGAATSGGADLLVGGGAVGAAAGIGASLGVSVIGTTTTAKIDDAADVTADAGGTALSYVTAFDGTFTSYLAGEKLVPAKLDGVAAATSNAEIPVTVADTENAGANLLLAKRSSTPVTASAKGVIVNAIDTVSVRAVAISGGAGAVAGISLSGDVPIITTTTTASVGSNARINQRDTGSAGAAQSVIVAAANDVYDLGVVGSVAGGGVAGLGAGISAVVENNTTSATIGDHAVVGARDDIVTSARGREDTATMAAAGGVAGALALTGGVAVLKLDDHTAATIGISAMVDAGNNVVVAADDITRAGTATGAFAVSLGGSVGIAASVALIDKDTRATIAADAAVTGLGQSAATFDESTGLDATTTRLAHGVLVDARSGESLYTVAVAAGGAAVAAAAGAISVDVLGITTLAAIDDGAHVTAGQTTGGTQDVAVVARDLTGISSLDGAVALALGGSLSGAADAGVLKSTVGATIGAATIDAKRDVVVDAVASKAIASKAVSGSGSLLALAAGISVYSIGNGVDPGGKGAAELQPDSGPSVGKSAGSSVSTGGSVNTLIGKTTSDQHATAAGGTIATDLGNVDVGAALAHQDTAIAGTSATVGAATITSGGALHVSSVDHVTDDAVVGAVAVGGIGVGAGIGVVSDNATNQASVIGRSTINAGSASVTAATTHTIDTTAYAGSLALALAVEGDVAYAVDTTTTTAAIDGVTIASSGTVAVEADSTRHLDSTAAGAAVALGAGVGISLAHAEIGGSTDARLGRVGGSGATIGDTATPSGAVSVKAIAADITASSALAVAGGLGGAASGADATSTVGGGVGVSVDGAQLTLASGVTLLGQADDGADAAARGVAIAGGLAVGASVATATMAPDVTVDITHANIAAASLDASATAQSAAVHADSFGAAGAFIGINATESDATDTSRAVVGAENSQLVTTGALNFTATLVGNTRANASGLAAGIVAVGANIARAISNNTTVAVLTDMTGVTAGSLKLGATGTDDDVATATAGSGGLIAGSAASATTAASDITHAGIETSGPLVPTPVIDGHTGTAQITATQTSIFGGSVDSTQASAVGMSGSQLTHTVFDTTTADIGAGVHLTAQNLTIRAQDFVRRLFIGESVFGLLPGSVTKTGNPDDFGFDVQSGSGGIIDAPAGSAATTVTQITAATIGAGAKVHLVPATTTSALTIEAYNEDIVHQKVKMDSGGAVAVAAARIPSQ